MGGGMVNANQVPMKIAEVDLGSWLKNLTY